MGIEITTWEEALAKVASEALEGVFSKVKLKHNEFRRFVAPKRRKAVFGHGEF